MKNLQPKKSEQQQLQQILNETFSNTGYIDQDIGQFMQDSSGTYQEMFNNNSSNNNKQQKDKGKEKKEKEKEKVDRRDTLFSNPSMVSRVSKESSRKCSDSGSQYGRGFGESFEEIDEAADRNNGDQNYNANQFEVFDEQEKNLSIQTSQPQLPLTNPLATSPEPPQHHKLAQYYAQYRKPPSLAQIRQKYPYFVISHPSYSITKTHHEEVFQYNTLKNLNIGCMDVGYCRVLEGFRIAIGSDDGRVALFQRTYTKPVHIFEAFSAKTSKSKSKTPVVQTKPKVLAIKWSQNLQYLAVSSSINQLNVYQFKQSITIESSTLLRPLKEPLQLFSLSPKDLQYPVTAIRFVSESPLVILLQCDGYDDGVEVLEYRMHIVSWRPYLSKLPVKFMDVYQVEVVDFEVGVRKDRDKSRIGKIIDTGDGVFNEMKEKSKSEGKEVLYGTLLAVSSDQYVTIALLRPYFQIIMVYDKDKHGKTIKKSGYSHISFRKHPLGLLIVWDKYAQLLNIEITCLNPLQSRINALGSQLLPETTLLAGLLTDNLVYQVVEAGVRVYAVGGFGEERDVGVFRQSIYEKGINFYEFPSGSEILQLLTQKVPTLPLLRLLSSNLTVCQDTLFLTTNTSLFSIRIQKFQQFIRNTIENQNNWKVGLQLLYDAYLGKYKNFDGMTQEVVRKGLWEYSGKYVNFLLLVIGNREGKNGNGNGHSHGNGGREDEDNLGSENQDSLWLQQLTFLINILIETQQYDHLFDRILPKLESSSLTRYMPTLSPFISLHRIPRITPTGLSLLYRCLPDTQAIKTLLLANLIPQQNELDLPHSVNGILLGEGMFEEMVAVNVGFGDWWTPFVVLVSYYEAMGVDKKEGRPRNDMELLAELRIRSKDSERSDQSSEEQRQKQKQQNQQQKQKKKQRLRQLIVYLTYSIISLINTPNPHPQNPLTLSQQKRTLSKQKQFLLTFLPLFQTSIIPILLDSPTEQLALFSSLLPLIFTGTSLQLINDIANKQHNGDLMTDIVMGIPRGRVNNLRAYWICLIELCNRSVVKMEVFMGLRYLVLEEIGGEGEREGGKDKGNRMAQKSRKKNSKANISMMQKFIQRTVIMSGAKLSSQFSKLSRPLLQQFYQQILSSPTTHVGLLIIVTIILGSGFYIRTILAMMAHSEYPGKMRKNSQVGTSPEHVSKNHDGYSAYDFIDETIGNFSKSEKQQLKSIMYENVEYYIQLDCERLCALIVEHFLGDIDKFVSFNTGSLLPTRDPTNSIIKSKSIISVNDHLLIQLIQRLVHKLQSPSVQSLKIDTFDPNNEWMLGLRLKFLRLLAITGRQNEILVEVQKESYPLDSSLEICRRYGVMDAEAYLLVKSGGEGEVASAIRLYFALISEKVKTLTPQSIPAFKTHFLSIISQCIKVCQNLHSSPSPHNFNSEWFLISQQLYSLKKKIYRMVVAYTGDLLCDIVDREVYPVLAEKMVRKEEGDGIVGYLGQQMGELDLGFVRVLLDEIVKNYSFQKVMFLLAQETYIESQIRQRKKIALQACKGFLTRATCYLCHQQNGLLIHYNSCGHEIHPSCGQDVKTCYVCTYRVQKMMERQFDLLRKVRVEVYGREGDNEQGDAITRDKKRREMVLEGMEKYERDRVDIQYL